jgi:CxxC motif-containing protein (DUF1111 family)
VGSAILCARVCVQINSQEYLFMKVKKISVSFLLLATAMRAQTDPGPRGGTAGAGGAIAGLSGSQAVYFTEGQSRFQEVEGVAQGLGPRFNSTSCSSCHSQPAVGGSSPASNPQVSVAPPGQLTAVASFITATGPAREARFVKNLSTGQPDGGVHDLFTIVGRSDNPPGCSISQPDFATNLANNNVIFRIPTPTFGGGLLEAITDTTIKTNLAANAGAKGVLGISGHVNSNGDGTVTRFGWKAQIKSLQLFTGAAYSVEMGVTNQIFQNEREENPQCAINGIPEDQTNFDSNQPLRAMSDVLGFSLFMRFLAPPAPVTSYGNVTAASITNGSAKFNSVGCGLCHTPSLQTGLSSVAALNQQTVNLFSDLAVHHMGAGLADGVTDGTARPDEFRTAPLWGIGQRLFFLHDGRTSDLMQAIQAHSSSGSEASAVVSAFNALSVSDRQDILNFLRSL